MKTRTITQIRKAKTTIKATSHRRSGSVDFVGVRGSTNTTSCAWFNVALACAC